MTHAHREYVDGCFTCKLRTLTFGEVPGAYRRSNSGTYFDKEILKDAMIPTTEEVEDRRSTALRKIREFEAESNA